MVRIVTRKFEAAVGGKLLHFGANKFLKDAELIEQQVTLPKGGLTVHYYERKGAGPTLLVCHGITDEAKNLAAFVILLKKDLPHWRIIIPDLLGHGHDMERARKKESNYEHPSPQRILESLTEFVNVLQIKQCYTFGMSMGGALAYFLQEQQPQLVKATILVNPAFESVLDPNFIEDFEQGKKNHFCVESRADIKCFFRDLSCPHRKRKNPVPKFFLEAIWQDRRKREPKGHFRGFTNRFLEERNKDPEWLGCTKDIAPDAKRLVIWPQDEFITNYDKGKAFFAESPKTTFHSVPDCGHLFHSDGKNILDHTAPLMIDYLLKQEEQAQINKVQ